MKSRMCLFLLASFYCLCTESEGRKSVMVPKPMLCVPQLNVKYFEKNDWSKLAVNVISLDSSETKGHLCFSSELFYRDLVYKQGSFKWVLSSWYMYVFICVCSDTWLMWCRTPCLCFLWPSLFSYFLFHCHFIFLSHVSPKVTLSLLLYILSCSKEKL